VEFTLRHKALISHPPVSRLCRISTSSTAPAVPLPLKGEGFWYSALLSRVVTRYYVFCPTQPKGFPSEGREALRKHAGGMFLAERAAERLTDEVECTRKQKYLIPHPPVKELSVYSTSSTAHAVPLPLKGEGFWGSTLLGRVVIGHHVSKFALPQKASPSRGSCQRLR